MVSLTTTTTAFIKPGNPLIT